MSGGILVVGDSYMPADAFLPSLQAVGLGPDTSLRTIDGARTVSIEEIREYQGDPSEISTWLEGHEVICLHAAPVTRQLLVDHPSVRMVACGRGGPVNIDLSAAAELGVTVTATPGKNAESVADLTVCSMIMLLRRVLPATASVRRKAEAGETEIDSTFMGQAWMAGEPRGRVLGLIGFGNVARTVAPVAEVLGMHVATFDPYVDVTTVPSWVEVVGLDELLRSSDVVSLHAPATGDTRHLIDRGSLAAMRAGSYLINTSRQSLVDEAALLDALRLGHLAGVALDVCEPTGLWHELVLRDDVVLTPHLGGATLETRDRGARMVAEEVRRHLGGLVPLHPALPR